MNPFEAMEIFTRVVVTGSFSAVAREMNTGQPKISKQIAALEDRLGSRLLNRTSRHLTLTEAGQSYYEHCLNILKQVADAEEEVQSFATNPRGRLRISASVAFGRLHLAPYLSEFLERYPQIQLDLSLSDHFVDLIGARIDVAIRIGALADSTLVARRLGNAPLVIVGAPGYFSRYGYPQHPHELRKHNCLVYTIQEGGHIWRFKKNNQELAVHVKGNCQSDNTDGIRDVIVAGTGLAMVPSWMVLKELETGLLETVLNDYLPWSTPINAIYPVNKYVPLKLRCFVDFLKEKYLEQNLFENL
ncbi:LysR family transcriptional regulator [Pelobacter seleniigenes]|uniref:LysR family transcriptional regulator n=1 Tax=Pelobacter seleniigenes TaxID=407188 RepID=UPI0004A73AD9|nr:LysR family transcriptional regulator [Pelobacter seleniigenes]